MFATGFAIISCYKMASLSAIVLIILAIFDITVSQETVIVSGPGSKSVEQFQPALFGCSVNNYDITTQVIAWVIDKEPISYDAQIDAEALDALLGPGQSSRYKVKLSLEGETYKCELNITSAQGPDSERDISCAVCTRNDRKCGRIQTESEKATLEVSYRPDTNMYPICHSYLPEASELYDSANQTTIILGQPVVLNCSSETANPPVTLKWFKNSNVEMEGTPSESGGYSSLEYQFTAALPDEDTSFKCTLRSEHFDIGSECVLPPVRVVSFPKVSLTSPGAIEAGNIHEFVCTAASNTTNSKEFTYEWEHEPSYNEPTVNSTQYGSVFAIKALSTDHGDEVKCIVTDPDGMKSFAVAKIKIKSELSIGAIVGIVAAVIFVICFVILIVFIAKRKKSDKKRRDESPPAPSAVPMLPSSIKPEKLQEQAYV